VVFRVLYNLSPLLVALPLYVMFERRVRREAATASSPTAEAPLESAESRAVVAGTRDPD
jgi:hypothetical protein